MAPTQLVVDLQALSRNLAVLRERGGGRAMFPAVKADAYGHGLVPVARHLEPEVAGFSVATVAEGVTLREAGITKPILKLSPACVEDLPAAVAHDLWLVVGSLAGIDDVASAAREAGTRATVHLKIDTGMRRVGVPVEDTGEAARRIVAYPELHLGGVMTHYAMADVEEGREFTALQRRRFDEAVEAVLQVTDVEWIHSGNSAAILGHDLGRDNAMRPGIAMYGSAPDLQADDVGLLDPVVRWTSTVTLVKPVRAGDGVSYGLTWAPERDTTVATVAVGYGDGYSRRLSSRGRVLIDGRAYPVVGRVCMDQILVDLGPGTTIAPGAEVVLIGSSGQEAITVAEVAELMGTIPYEVTCLITPRVPRRHR